MSGGVLCVHPRVISQQPDKLQSIYLPRDIFPPKNQFANLLSHFLKDYIAEYNPIGVSSTYGGVHFYRSHVIVVELGC